MKALFLSSTNNIKNGYGNFTHELCSFLKDKIDFTLLLPEKEPRFDYTDYKVEYVLPDYIFDAKTPKILKYLRFKYNFSADFVHSFFELPYAYIGARLSKKNGIPFIIGTQGTYAIQPLFSWPEKIILKKAYNTAKVIIAPSQFTRDCIVKYANPKPPVKIIHNGVNFERFQKEVDFDYIKKEYGNKKILLTVGGIKSRKGQDVVIKALSLLKKKRGDFHYFIVGSGDKFKAELLKLAIAGNVLDDITFTGEIEGDELIKYYRACDIYIHTPRVINWNFEGFGIVYLEASACRKPIIAADAGGIRDAVLDGKTGLVVEENNIEATANAINKLFDSSELRKQLGNNGWLYAKENDWKNIGKQFLDLYNSI